jgi:cytochrome c peroxidase
MIRTSIFILFMAAVALITVSFRNSEHNASYGNLYTQRILAFQSSCTQLLNTINQSDLSVPENIDRIKDQIQLTRQSLKQVDFWLRYFDPIAHKKINGPLPVEWETEVFEKFEKPYKRDGAGLTLAYQYLHEQTPDKKKLANLIEQSINASHSYLHDSITQFLTSYHHFFLCNRLYLLNLATLYTTGFECPETESIIPELRLLMSETQKTYTQFNENFNTTPLSKSYQDVYADAIQFVKTQPDDYTLFDHYSFIRKYINPLFALNQQMIIQFKVISKNLVDYSLNKQATSIFSKNLYFGQNPKGIFTRVKDEATLAEINTLGKQLFFDPILSGNTERSCASCHIPTQYFADTTNRTSEAFDHKGLLARNSPSLLNAQYNHLLMVDGKHYTLQAQVKGVVSNPAEMGGNETDMVQKVLSCKQYLKTFTKLLKQTPQEKTITSDHIASAITYYYSQFSQFDSPFDRAMNLQTQVSTNVQQGFNLFMGKAQCATCHFAPQFNGVKPPYIGSEFEVLGVPKDSNYSALSDDKGRYEVNPAEQTLNAFRTGTLRNAAYTKPYMHNGVFTNLMQVIDFYDAGGGAGHGLPVPNQTLSSDSLHLTPQEKQYLIDFIESLTEDVPVENAPVRLPLSSNKQFNSRKIGGSY